MAKKKKAAEKAPEPESPLTQKFIDEINEKMDEMKEDLEKSIKVAASAKRARKASSDLTKMFKDFRKYSVEHFKK